MFMKSSKINVMAEFITPIKKNKVLSEEQITIPPSPFLNRLGYGTGVSVMQLVRSPKAGQIRSPWALKMINKRVKPNKVYSERLQAEAALLQRMSHPNIVGFRAFGQSKILYLGMEACDLSLGDMIEKRVEDGNCEIFKQKQILKVASDIGDALDYLHTKMQILHGDIKSYNILVNGDFVVCKLCDFGVTLPLDENGVFDKNNSKNLVYYGTEAWSAPEVIYGEEISSKSDVWPLGLTLWEMLALTPPHSLIDDSTLDQSLDESALDQSDDIGSDRFQLYGTRPAIPCDVDPRVYAESLALFYSCTERDPNTRPSASRLARAAKTFLEPPPPPQSSHID